MRKWFWHTRERFKVIHYAHTYVRMYVCVYAYVSVHDRNVINEWKYYFLFLTEAYPSKSKKNKNPKKICQVYFN